MADINDERRTEADYRRRDLGPDDMAGLRDRVSEMIALAAAEHAAFRKTIGPVIGDGGSPGDARGTDDPQLRLEDVERIMESVRDALGIDGDPEVLLAAEEHVARMTQAEVRIDTGHPRPVDPRPVGPAYSPKFTKAVLWTLVGATVLGLIALLSVM